VNILLVKGKLWHKRFMPKPNTFKFTHHMFLLDLKPQNLNGNGNINRIFRINPANHLQQYDGDILTKLHKTLGLPPNYDEYDYKMLTTPSFLGYSFNPATVYFCLNKTAKIIAVAVEVHNTFGESHTYVLNDSTQISGKNKTHKIEKQFHVSPFIARKGLYEFTFKITPKMVFITINLIQENKLIISTKYYGTLMTRKEIGSFLAPIAIIWSIVTTEIRILIEAFKLHFLKKIHYHQKPTPLKNTFEANARGLISRLKIPFNREKYKN